MKATGHLRRVSMLMVLVSALMFSFNGLIVRLLEQTTPAQAVFYRSLGMTGALLVVYSVLYRGSAVRHITAVGWLGMLGGLLMGAAMITSFTAMFYTTIANVVFVSSAIPFFTAALAWVILKEKVPGKTLIYMALAFGGIAVMVGGGVRVGAGLGNLLALLSALMYSSFVVIVRRRRDTNMTPVVAVSGVWVCIYSLLFTGGALDVPVRDLLLCLFWGAVIAAGGHSLFVLAARNLAGADVTFLMLPEFVLAPIWVWLVVDEIPAGTTLVGGAIVMGSLAWWTLSMARRV